MIYLFISATLTPVQEMWGPMDLERRKGRYMRCIAATLHATEHIDSSVMKKVIVVNDIGVTESYMDEFKETDCVDVLYTSSNRTDTKHKGLCEVDSIQYAMNHYNVKDDDIVIKQTGRYCLCDENPSHVFSNIINHMDSHDCFMKFYNIALEQYDENDTTMGLYGMRAKYLKKFQFKHQCIILDPSPQSAEQEFAEYIHNYIPPERIFTFGMLYLECCPANNPDTLVYV